MQQKDISIHAFQKDIMDRLQFSIGGDAYIEEKILIFLQNLSESTILSDNANLKFVMAGFARIELSQGDLAEIFKGVWKTKKLKSIYYYDYEDHQVEDLLSFYQYCFHTLDNVKNATNIICINNFSGINMRIKINTGIDKIKITYNRRLETIDAYFPSNFFNSSIKSDFFSNGLHDDFQVDKNFLLMKRNIHNWHEFFVNQDHYEKARDVYDLLMKKIFVPGKSPIDFKNNNKENFILNYNNTGTLLKDLLNNEKACVEDIYNMVFMGGILAYFLDCDIEYFTSVANNISGKSYSLGAIAVGYKENEMPRDFRAIFSLVSNHIASNLSAQVVVESNNILLYLHQRDKSILFIQDLVKEVDMLNKGVNGAEINSIADSHGENIREYLSKDNAHKIVSGTNFTLNGKVYGQKDLDNMFGYGFFEYLKAIFREGEKIDWGLFYGIHSGIHSDFGSVNYLYKYSTQKGKIRNIDLNLKRKDIKLNGDGSRVNKPIVNAYLPHLLIKMLLEDNSRKPEKLFVTCEDDTKICITAVYKENISLCDFVHALTNENGPSSVRRFFPKIYNAICVCGDLIIEVDNSKVSFKRDFKQFEDNSFVFLNDSTQLKTSKTLRYMLDYKIIN